MTFTEQVTQAAAGLPADYVQRRLQACEIQEEAGTVSVKDTTGITLKGDPATLARALASHFLATAPRSALQQGEADYFDSLRRKVRSDQTPKVSAVVAERLGLTRRELP